jgi:hypothetical protein
VVRTLAPVPIKRSGDKIVAPPKSDLGRGRTPFLERGKVEKREQPVRTIEPRDRNIGVKPPVQVRPQPERKVVIERDKVEKERGDSDRGNERGSGGGREGRK